MTTYHITGLFLGFLLSVSLSHAEVGQSRVFSETDTNSIRSVVVVDSEVDTPWTTTARFAGMSHRYVEPSTTASEVIGLGSGYGSPGGRKYALLGLYGGTTLGAGLSIWPALVYMNPVVFVGGTVAGAYYGAKYGSEAVTPERQRNTRLLAIIGTVVLLADIVLIGSVVSSAGAVF
jgi:hypothetical protein